MVQRLHVKLTVLISTVNKDNTVKRLLLLTFIGITGCTANSELLSSNNTQPKANTNVVLDKTIQKRSASLYKCKNDKQVRVVRIIKSSKNTKKVKTDEINLTFEGVTEKLNATPYQTGKFYTNIHWQWLEKADSSSLYNSIGNVLAEGCIEQQ
ncbi:hypothetical protein O1Q80_00604 [Lonepinella sp. MS14435]